jgi:hypothetical protein
MSTTPKLPEPLESIVRHAVDEALLPGYIDTLKKSPAMQDEIEKELLGAFLGDPVAKNWIENDGRLLVKALREIKENKGP